jgi:hypothetical protein
LSTNIILACIYARTKILTSFVSEIEKSFDNVETRENSERGRQRRKKNKK